MSDLPMKIDLLYKKGILNQKEWRRLLNCLLCLDGLKLQGKYPLEAQEYVEEVLEILIKKFEELPEGLHTLCPECGGKGWIPTIPAGKMVCSKCHGTGVVET